MMLRKLDSQVRYSYKTKSSSYKLPESIKNKDLNVRSRAKKKKNINGGSNLGNCNRQDFFSGEENQSSKNKSNNQQMILHKTEKPLNKRK